MSTTTYHVAGMTCEHCVASVTEEISEVPGVIGVDVDLAAGRVQVSSETVPTLESIRAAVEEAGYSLVGS